VILRLAVAALISLAAACSRSAPPSESGKVVPTYDKTTGKLKQLTFDRNHNGVIDTWTDMDGARPVMSRIDSNEDGRIDRWEYYDGAGKLVKVGFSRKNDGRPDAWAYQAPDGTIDHVEVSSTGDDHRIDRWEFYQNNQLVRAEEDTNGDGRPDAWETYENGVLQTAAFDENGDGVPDRRLTYDNGELALIETGPDGHGGFTNKVTVKSSGNR
jgi:hypothetical protein